jgi:hypothetical protein
MSAQATLDTSEVSIIGIAEETTQDLVESNVKPLPGNPEGAALAAVNGFTYRHDWGNRRGQHVLNLNSSSFRAGQKVFVSIAEGAAGGPGAGMFVGAARYTVHNVAPQNGRVTIWINIEWSSNLRIYADYLVVD